MTDLQTRIREFLAEVHSPDTLLTARDKLVVAVGLLREVPLYEAADEATHARVNQAVADGRITDDRKPEDRL